jgi:hypothetical protein
MLDIPGPHPLVDRHSYEHKFSLFVVNKADVEYFLLIVLMLQMILLTWAGGVIQYLVEWRWFAGGHRSGLKFILSRGLTMILSYFILLFSMITTIIMYVFGPNNFRATHWVFSVALAILILLGLSFAVYWYGQNLRKRAIEIVWKRFGGESPDYEAGRDWRSGVFELLRLPVSGR